MTPAEKMWRVQSFLDAQPTASPVYVMKDYTVNQLRSDLKAVLNHWSTRLDQILAKQ